MAYSGGKGSSVLANLALTAALAAQSEGRRALLVITHAEVGAVRRDESTVRAGSIARRGEPRGCGPTPRAGSA